MLGPQIWTKYTSWGLTRGELEGQNHFARPAGHTAFAAALGYTWLGNLRCTLPDRVELLVHQHCQGSPSLQGCSESILYPACVWASDCSDPGAGPCTCLVKLHEAPMVPPLQPVKVPLDAIPSLQCVNQTTWLGVRVDVALEVKTLLFPVCIEILQCILSTAVFFTLFLRLFPFLLIAGIFWKAFQIYGSVLKNNVEKKKNIITVSLILL